MNVIEILIAEMISVAGVSDCAYFTTFICALSEQAAQVPEALDFHRLPARRHELL